MKAALLLAALLAPLAARAQSPERSWEYVRLLDVSGRKLDAWRLHSSTAAGGVSARVFHEENTREVVVVVTSTAAFDGGFEAARRLVKATKLDCRCEPIVAGRGLGGGYAQYAAYTVGLPAYLLDPVAPDRAGHLKLMGCEKSGDCKGDEERVHNLITAGDPAARAGALIGHTHAFDPSRPPAPAAGASSGPRRTEPSRSQVEWVRIAGGTFTMGSGQGDEGPRHPVAVKTFEIARTPVTNRQYQACVDAGACLATEDCEPRSRDGEHPVVCVDWEAARRFSEWAGGRLPSESEWEYAARSGGKDRKYPWGDSPPDCTKAVMQGCDETTAPVCSRPAGNTEQGLCDMAGNVWQWTQDWYRNSYNGAPADGSAWEGREGAFRVFRGGSFLFDATYTRATQRRCDVAGTRCGRVGFRPVRDVSP